MKIWIKLLIGTGIGILLGIFLPIQSIDGKETLPYLVTLVIHIGRYCIFALLFFSIAIGTYELRQEKKLIRVYARILGYMIFGTFLLALIGTATALIIPLERIPIIMEQETARTMTGIKDLILQVFPKNIFKVFITKGNFLFPVFFLAFFLGLNFNFDRLTTRPAIQFFDSMSRIFYHINSFIVELFGLGIIILSTYFITQIRLTQEIQLYKQLLVILVIDTGIVLFGIFPALLYLLGNKENPYKWLYAVTAPAITAFLSRDGYFSISSLTKHGKENLGIPRSIGSASFSLFAMFGKAGTAMVTSISFIVILTSYSSLGISIMQALWVLLFSILLSFTLATVPGSGTIVALSAICALHGKGIEEGYLILGPIMPLLLSFSVLLDVVTSAFSTFLVAKHENMHTSVETGDFI